MRRKLTTALALSAFFCLSVWIAGNEPVNSQTQITPTDNLKFQQTLARRAAVLDRDELRRHQILDRLEFLPRLPSPFPFPFPFPHFCLVPVATPAAAIDPHRSLFVHDRPTLDAKDFSLKRTLTQIAAQVTPTVAGTTAVTIFRQLWDTQNTPPGVVPGSPKCLGTLNGFPINCPRREGQEALGTAAQIDARMATYKPIGLVNRIDLAHQGWRNCGEYRIVYGKSGGGISKNLIIFEAVLPNPRPGCREGCVPVAEFWKSLSAINDPNIRAQRLEQFYYFGLPGFRPVVHVSHYDASGVTSSYGSSGSGQIRTNQFLQPPIANPFLNPWILKEFKTVIDCSGPCTFNIVPTMVRVNPHGTLWNADNVTAKALDFRADTVLQKPQLGSGSLMGISYGVDLDNDAGQSMSFPGLGFVDNYRQQMNGAANPAFRIAMVNGALTANQMANRALTQSCAGCHQPSVFGLLAANSIGPVSTPPGSVPPIVDSWPDVVGAGFVHVDIPTFVQPELAANPAAFGAGQGQEISDALLQFFLPDRKNFLLGQLNAPRCTCRHRFLFLDATQRKVALEIQEKVRIQFEPRFTALEQKEMELRATNQDKRNRDDRNIEGLISIARERDNVRAEEEKALVEELRQRGITLPDDEQLQVKPQPLKLRARGVVRGSVAQQADWLAEEVNEVLRQEPPRRTVTGSFRVH